MVAVIDDLLIALGGAVTIIGKFPGWLDYLIFLGVISVPWLGSPIAGIISFATSSFGIPIDYPVFVLGCYLIGLFLLALKIRHPL